MQYKIHIPAPCHESWANMSPTEKGRFCTSCKKEVTDFTAMTESQIYLYVKGKDAVCGRVTSKQLQKTPVLRETSWSVNWAMAIGLNAILLVSVPIYGQSTTVDNQQTIIQMVDQVEVGNEIQNDSLMLQGFVMDELGDPLPFVNIILQVYSYGSWSTIRGTTTDLDGNYTMKELEGLEADTLQLEISNIGFETKIVAVSPDFMEIQLIEGGEGPYLLGDVQILIERPDFKGSIFTRDGNDFIQEQH